MLVHLGGTMVPSPKMAPLAVMVTMNAKQGVDMLQLMQRHMTILIHYNGYNVSTNCLLVH